MSCKHTVIRVLRSTLTLGSEAPLSQLYLGCPHLLLHTTVNSALEWLYVFILCVYFVYSLRYNSEYLYRRYRLPERRAWKSKCNSATRY